MATTDTPEQHSGARTLDDPEFRTWRARRASAAAHSTQGVINKFLKHLDELTPEQIETVRRALPPAPEAGDADAA